MSESIPQIEAAEQVVEEVKVTTYSLADVATHNTKEDLWVVINSKVYDVTKFLDEHPGGLEVLMEVAGKDATKEWEDIGHSESARELMKQYCIGETPKEDEASADEDASGVVAFTSCLKSFISLKSKFGFKK